MFRRRVKRKSFPITLQPRQQELFDSEAFVTIYGGQAGGGKSFGVMAGLLSLSLQYPKFKAVAFRKTLPQAKQPGGLWPMIMELGLQVGYKTNLSDLTVTNKDNGSLIKVAQIHRATVKKDYQGAEYDVMAFDEGTHFSGEEVVYMFSRIRNPWCNLSHKRMWITCNPDPNSFLKHWLAPWVDPDHKLYEKVKPDDMLYMRLGETPEEVTHWQERPDKDAASIRFVPSALADNKYLGDEYRRNLERLTRVERNQLLYGSWNEITGAGQCFDTDNLPITKDEIDGRKVRAWDTASSIKDHSDYTAGVLMAHDFENQITQVQHVSRKRIASSTLENHIVHQARIDGPDVEIAIEQEPASQAAAWSESLAATLQMQGFVCHLERVQKDKVTRSLRFQQAAQHGKVSLLEHRTWNAAYRHELVEFPNGIHDDQVDASSLAFNTLVPDPAGAFVVAGGGIWAQ